MNVLEEPTVRNLQVEGTPTLYHEDEDSRFFRNVGTFLQGVISQKKVIKIQQ
jgi:hypothetical protein